MPTWIQSRRWRLSETLLSTWTLAAMLVLSSALFIEECIGGPLTGSHVTPESPSPISRVLADAAWLGLPPITAAVGLITALWLGRRKRHRAAAAATTVAVVVIAFSARPLLAPSVEGWRDAFTQSALGGRTTAATAMAIVIGFVLAREQLARKSVSTVIALGFPVLIGLSRVAEGVYTPGQVARHWLFGAFMAFGIAWAYVLSEESALAGATSSDG